MWTKRAEDLIAAFVLGNGVLDLIAPRQRVLLWLFGPQRLRKLTLWFADHPTAMRLRGIVRIATGLWLALRQYRQAPQPTSFSWHQRWLSRYRLAEQRRSVVLLAAVGLGAAILLIITFIYRRNSTRREAARSRGKLRPSVSRVIELSATSEESFEDAINQGVKRATSTLRNVESAWIKDKNVLIENNKVVAYKVNMAITFVLEEGEQLS
jgi:flavin-binding protein dodecin